MYHDTLICRMPVMFRRLQRCLLSLSLCRFSGHWSLKYRKSLLLPPAFSNNQYNHSLKLSQVISSLSFYLFVPLGNFAKHPDTWCHSGLFWGDFNDFNRHQRWVLLPPTGSTRVGVQKKSLGAWWICERQRWKAVNCKFVFRSLQTRSFRLRNPRNPDPEDFNKPSFNPT